MVEHQGLDVDSAAQDVDSAAAQLLDLALLALAGVALAVLPQQAFLAVLSLLAVVVDLAAEEDSEALVHLRSRQSFSAAMARNTT